MFFCHLYIDKILQICVCNKHFNICNIFDLNEINFNKMKFNWNTYEVTVNWKFTKKCIQYLAVEYIFSWNGVQFSLIGINALKIVCHGYIFFFYFVYQNSLQNPLKIFNLDQSTHFGICVFMIVQTYVQIIKINSFE